MAEQAQRSSGPVLEGDAARAAAHRGSHVQIIAAAGSGKTEVVSQRVAAATEVPPKWLNSSADG